MSKPAKGETSLVEWDHLSPSEFESPLVWTGPFVECKLEHPSLEPTCLGTQFFPDSVPYRADSERRIFYWRSRLPDVTRSPDTWTGLCATTHELTALVHGEGSTPTLLQTCDAGYELVVDGTIVGDAETALVSDYSRPAIELRHMTRDCVEFSIEGEIRLVPTGNRERIELPEQVIETEYDTSLPTNPELGIRYPGTRTVYHPAPSEEYRLFPSCGISLDDVPQSLTVPTRWGELDHERLATNLGIDVPSQPYPERILWQAFAFTAFNPDTDKSVELTQFQSGEIAVRTEQR